MKQLARAALIPDLRHVTRTAKPGAKHRNLSEWCDYGDAHRGVRWRAVTGDGVVFGQSCNMHLGALLIDVCRAAPGTAPRLMPTQPMDRSVEPV